MVLCSFSWYNDPQAWWTSPSCECHNWINTCNLFTEDCIYLIILSFTGGVLCKPSITRSTLSWDSMIEHIILVNSLDGVTNPPLSLIARSDCGLVTVTSSNRLMMQSPQIISRVLVTYLASKKKPQSKLQSSTWGLWKKNLFSFIFKVHVHCI